VQNRKRTLLLFSLLLIAVNLFVFREVHSYEFVGVDNALHVYDNPYFNDPTGVRILPFWTAPYWNLYIPLTYTAWGAQFRLASYRGEDGILKVDPSFFHWTNLFLHILNSLLVFLLLWKFVRNSFSAWVGALFFSLHPLQVESVAWISSFKGTFAAFFSLLAILGYIQNHKKWAFLAFFLALLSKPVAVTLIPMFWVFDRLQNREESIGRFIYRFRYWILTTIPFILYTKWRQWELPSSISIPWHLRPFIAADSFTFYLGKLLFPFYLTYNYHRSVDGLLKNGWLPYVAFIPILTGYLLWKKRETRIGWTAALLFIANLLPVLSFMSFDFQEQSTVADRFTYLSLIGPALAIAWGLRSRPKTWAAFTAVFITLGYGYLSFQQAKIWRSEITLQYQQTKVAPNSKSHLLLAQLLEDEMKRRGDDRPEWKEKILHHYEEADRLYKEESKL